MKKNNIKVAVILGSLFLTSNPATAASFDCTGECVKNGKSTKEVHCGVSARDQIEAILKALDACKNQCGGSFGILDIHSCEEQ